MDTILSKKLPPELVDIIARLVHEKNLKLVHEQLLHGVVWILHNGQPTFWVCNVYNRYSVLSDDEIWKRINRRRKNI